MSSKKLLKAFVSARAIILLLSLVAFLLLLNVALPQASVLGEESYQAMLESSGPVARLFLETLGFGRMATSPIFLGALGLFFLNLAVVLLTRIGPTWRRIALKPRAEEGLKAWARMEESFSAPRPEALSSGPVARILRGYGFQVRKVGERTMWGVKHRTAPLGFLLFHLSFFLLCAGGLLIYYTRFVGTAVLTEGQAFAGEYSQVLRQPPFGGPPDLRFMVESVETRMQDGEPVHLQATLVIDQGGASARRISRVNHPAKWGATTILVERAGLSPVLWLQDPAGFTLDRAVIPAKTRDMEPTIAPLVDGRWTLLISPLGPGAAFPERSDLGETELTFQVVSEDESLFLDSLRPGDAADFEGGRFVLEEMRYWVGVRIIAERGGGLLAIGFTAGILGLIWRLLWYRREVAVTWDDTEFRLVGRSEYFSDRFKGELEGIFEMLQTGGTT